MSGMTTSNTYKIGCRVRLRDGVLPWIAQRDGLEYRLEVTGSPGRSLALLRAGTGRFIVAEWDEIEPEAPPIPPEPKRVAGQAWLDADGGLVQTDNAEGSPLAYILTGAESVVRWQELAHPLTPLYPVPDPDDDEAVRLLALESEQYASEVRAVLRALRGDA